MILDDCLFFPCFIGIGMALEALLGCGQLVSWDSFDTWLVFQHISRWFIPITCFICPANRLKTSKRWMFPIHIQQVLYSFSLHLCVSRISHFVQLWVKKKLVHYSWSYGPQGNRESQIQSWRSHMTWYPEEVKSVEMDILDVDIRLNIIWGYPA